MENFIKELIKLVEISVEICLTNRYETRVFSACKWFIQFVRVMVELCKYLKNRLKN